MNQPKTKREAEQQIREAERREARCHSAIKEMGASLEVSDIRSEYLAAADRYSAEAARLRALLPTLPE